MKKCYFALMVMLLALVSVGFAACGDDDEPKNSEIVGTWQQKIVGIGDGTDMILLQFTKDGKYHQANTRIVSFDKVVVYHGTYTVSGNKLTVTYIYTYETETVKCTYQVKGDKLTITTEDGDGASTFIRVEDSVIEPYLQNM